jgi:RNA chaperone Hfq
MVTDFRNSLRPPLTKPQIIEKAKPTAPTKAPTPAILEPTREPRECDATLYARAKAERRAVTFRLVDGTTVAGMIVSWSRFSVLVDAQGALEVIFKHSMVSARLAER